MVDEEADIIRFSHCRTKEYLNRVRDQRFLNAQVEIMQCCLAYLSLDPFESKPCLETKLSDRILESPFAVYTAEFWARHVKRKEKKHIGHIVKLLTMENIQGCWINSSQKYRGVNF